MASGSVTPLPVSPRVGRLQPTSLSDVSIAGGFWAEQQKLNRTAILPHCDASLERVGWIENFRAAVRGSLATDRVGRLFTDSEIYKTMEAMAWEVARCPSSDLSARLSSLSRLVASAQHEDGYLNTFYGYVGGPDRYSDMEWGHELYCFGHLIQAAVAVSRAGGPAEVIEVARRAADHVCEEFGPEGRQTICGHPEIETALVELYRATGRREYLDQAALFVDRRGHRVLDDTMFRGRDYYQDNVPVRDAEILVGHSVRALYLAAGAIDVAIETSDSDLLVAVRAQYDRTLDRRTYLTGGMGSNHHGETFGDDFELPSERAYAETCAAVASIHVAWRLLLATGESRYADVIERTLYNAVASSPSREGRRYFYVNALQRSTPGIEPEPGVPSLRRTDGTRADWFTTSCCPTNLARTWASLSAYFVTTDPIGVQVHQYAEGTMRVSFAEDRFVAMTVTTAYPNDGAIVLRINETDGREWDLTLRIPGWAEVAVLDDGHEVAEVRPGMVTRRRAWAVGDEITLNLDMSARFVYPDPRIDDVRGCVARERGPLVYAIESIDHPDVDLDLLEVDTSSPLSTAPMNDLRLDGVEVVTALGAVRRQPPAAWPYARAEFDRDVSQIPVTLIPYFAWANRGSSTMRVWIPKAG